MNKRLSRKDRFELLKKAVLESKLDMFTLQMGDGLYECYFKDIIIINNELDKSNPAYEEYEAILFSAKDSDEIYKLDYHILPIAVYADKGTIFDVYKSKEESPYKIDFDFFNPLTDQCNSGYTFIDNDFELLKRYLKVKELLKAPYVFMDNNEARFDNDIYMKVEKDLLEAYDDFIDYYHNHSKGQNTIVDLFEPSYESDKNKPLIDKFTKKDFDFISEGSPLPILNKGAKFYTNGDYENAYPYYLIAAMKGEPNAISNLGYCYMYGRGVEKNIDLALSCFLIASKNNAIEATYKLGTLYKYNEQIKDLSLSKKYFIKAMSQIRYSNDKTYVDFPSLCLAIAKEKIYGQSFVKDIYGAFLLLIFAYRGYKIDLDAGFTPHEKQYNETLELFTNKIFDKAKKYYRKKLEYSYEFGDYELTFEEYCSDNILLIGDKALVLVNACKYINDNEINVKPGDEVIVEKMYDDYCLARLVNSSEQELIDFTFDELRKK